MRSPAGRSVLPRSTSSSKCGGTAHRGGSAAGILTPSILACTPGTGLGPYEIVASLGAGAMGEVHRARDTRLNRDVAIKSLSGAVARDPDRRERFEREEQTIAALNHRNIVTIHAVERLRPVPGASPRDAEHVASGWGR